MIIATIDELEALYGVPKQSSLAKEVDHVTADYRAIIEASPFAVLATAGPDGLDCSPRGDAQGFVRVADGRTLVMPDRRGNDRIDSLRNVLADPRVALLFLVPGLVMTLRVNGRAAISAEPKLLASFEMEGKRPRSALVITVEAVYFQCARAVLRSRLWEPDARVSPAALPSAGEILARITQDEIGGEAYDRELPERLKTSLW